MRINKLGNDNAVKDLNENENGLANETDEYKIQYRQFRGKVRQSDINVPKNRIKIESFAFI